MIGTIIYNYYQPTVTPETSGIIIGVTAILACIVIGGIEYRKRYKHASNSPPLLEIEYAEDGRFLHQGEPEGHGWENGPWLTHRLVIHNGNTAKPLHGVESQIITLIDETGNFPQHLIGIITLPYSLPFSDSGERSIPLSPNQRKSVDVFAYHRHFSNPDIHLGNRQGMKIYGGVYTVTIQISCLDTKATSGSFSIGLSGGTGGFSDPFMKAIAPS